ncbi:MAG: DNA polymerase III subunit delta [Clostridia bacterium]|nr:DNA polymerase III subunit delta [Clostridia bacterium]
MSIDILKDDLKKNNLRSLYLFYGPEDYLKKYYTEGIEKQLLTEDMKTLNKIVLEGKVDVRKITDNCETMPVFSERKVVIVKNSGIFKSKKKSDEAEGKGKSKGQNDELVSYLQNVPDYNCLIFYEEEIDKRMKAVDAIKKNGLIVEFAYQKPPELVKWVVKVFKSHKKEVDPMTAAQLIDISEQGMTEILNEINKLTLYLGDRTKVTGADIEKVCTKSVKSRIFDLTDAVAEKNASKALILLNDMIILKEPMPKILFMLARQFRQVLEMKLLGEDGLNSGEAASKMGITPYAAGKILKQAKSFTVDMLKEAVEACLEFDVAIKTGKMNDRIAAELLIARFSTK